MASHPRVFLRDQTWSTMTYERILVPTDGSDCADGGVDRAIELAAAFDAAVHALYVVDEARAGDWDVVVERQERAGETALDDAGRAGAEAEVDVSKHLRRGHPDEEILDFVADEGSDLIVMGTAGRSGFDRIRHAGSTTERVIRGATVSVLAVPPGEGK